MIDDDRPDTDDDRADTGTSPQNPDAPDHEPTDANLSGDAARKIEDARKAQNDELTHAEDDAGTTPIADADDPTRPAGTGLGSAGADRVHGAASRDRRRTTRSRRRHHHPVRRRPETFAFTWVTWRRRA